MYRQDWKQPIEHWVLITHWALSTLGPPKKLQHLTRAEDVAITLLWIEHTKATKSHILSRGPTTTCHHCGQTLTVDHMLQECTVLQESPDEYYTADSLNTLQDNSWDFHCGIPMKSGILLSHMNCQTFYAFPYLNYPGTDAIFKLQLALKPGQYSQAWLICSEIEISYERHLLI